MFCKAVILEDDTMQAERLQRFLLDYQHTHPDTAFDITLYSDIASLKAGYSNDTDLLLLDIQLPDGNSMELARELHENEGCPIIVFITALAQYAINGYDVGAFDYMVKPVNANLFRVKMDRILRTLERERSCVLLDIKTKEGSWRVPSNDILYIESDGHDILVHTAEGVRRSRTTLTEIEQKLDAGNFARCNACYLVNLRYVHGIIKDAVRIGEELLSISQARRRPFLEAVAVYKGGKRM